MKKILRFFIQFMAAAFLPVILLAQESADTLKIKAVTQNPHGLISIACDACHATGDWKIVKKDMAFDHNTQTDFILEGQHRSGDCKSCHANNQFAGSKTECYQCHKDIHEGQLGKQCKQCHTSKSWQPFNFKTQHDLTRFPLIGKHATTDCQSCHKDQQQNEFKGLTIVCSGCHRADFIAASNPNHVLKNFPTTCEACHTPQGWSPALIIDHSLFGFELTQGHKNIPCTRCHADGNYSTISMDCYSCHKNDYDQSTDPNHMSGHYSTHCVDCHTTLPGWSPAKFDHSVTAFPLTGAHLTAQNKCTSCHVSGFMNTSKLCYSCHQNDYLQSRNPNHAGRNFSHLCEQCHTTASGWKPATFDHSVSAFPLTGGHLLVQDQCQQCHATGYNSTPTNCYACHQADYTGSVNPNHVTGNFSTHCEQCHTSNPGWKPATFDHSNSAFPLTGAHLSVQTECLKCHSSGFTNTPTNCYACHQQDFATATNPNHLTGNYSTNCIVCHTTNPGWQPVVYNHNLTNFPLTGAHLLIQNQCIACHAGGYLHTPSTCYGCHQSDFNGTTNPNHISNNFPTNCIQCHSTNPGWKPAIFDHNATSFPLTGAHLTVANQCVSCHASGYANTPTNCYACHQTAYTNATNPNHVTGGFPTTCAQCHTTNPGWRPATFDHNATGFPITGAHQAIANQCLLCHANGYVNTPNNCFACHLSDYNAAVNPNHAGLQFPTTCENGCHTTTAWTPSSFNHTTYTSYALVGAHQTIASQCSKCHSGNLQSASTACYSCHQTNYNNSTQPNHAGSGFSHDCQNCHGQTVWVPWTVNHDAQYFPINSGKHNRKWTGCGGGSGNGAGCHTDNSNWRLFSCIHCHEHSLSSMNDHHKEVNNYAYNSQACFTCHPQGSTGSGKIKRTPIRGF